MTISEFLQCAAEISGRCRLSRRRGRPLATGARSANSRFRSHRPLPRKTAVVMLGPDGSIKKRGPADRTCHRSFERRLFSLVLGVAVVPCSQHSPFCTARQLAAFSASISFSRSAVTSFPLSHIVRKFSTGSFLIKRVFRLYPLVIVFCLFQYWLHVASIVDVTVDHSWSRILWNDAFARLGGALLRGHMDT